MYTYDNAPLTGYGSLGATAPAKVNPMTGMFSSNAVTNLQAMYNAYVQAPRGNEANNDSNYTKILIPAAKKANFLTFPTLAQAQANRAEFQANQDAMARGEASSFTPLDIAKEEEGSSTGTIIAVLAGVAILGGIGYYMYKKKKSQPSAA